MNADLLRRAAQKLREHANDAEIEAPPFWYQAPVDPRPERGVWSSLQVQRCVTVHESSETPCLSEYIALMHPPVALALADLLDGHRDSPCSHLLALARAVLREPDPNGGA
jgi:hypothetical protein